jgi:flagellar protein FliO/FliZ
VDTPVVSLLWFALILALIPATLWMLKRLPAVKGTQSAASRVVGVLPLSGSQRILTVEVGTGEHKTWLVLGVTPSNIQLLHTLPPQDTDTTAPGTHPSFAQALQRLRPGAADKP